MPNEDVEGLVTRGGAKEEEVEWNVVVTEEDVVKLAVEDL